MDEENQTATFQIRLKPQLKEEFNRIAKKNGDTQTELIRKWIDEYIKNDDEKGRGLND
ncbi:CopG family transcriptional regulator [Lentibacillus jeotgali]|uniref:ribbon-helix-helix domain-containing protein n=1 Tax=Lentibacillus jeotgali TaxID=558169 RepID=UPI000262601D|nr:CopG family transcriptional regulator [Lentibacillus jeotgali]